MPIVQSPEGYPSKWKRFCQEQPGMGSEIFGLGEDLGNVNRFAARFRAANCFLGMGFEGYTTETANGYSALCHVILCWSAFERFLQIKGRTVQQASLALQQHGADNVLAAIRAEDKGDKFYEFIYNRVNPRHKKELDQYFQSNPCNIAYLASAIRHIFAHGWLSPNANDTEPRAVVNICRILCEFLLTFMDKEFSRHIDQVYEQ